MPTIAFIQGCRAAVVMNFAQSLKCRAVAATTAGTAMAVPVFVGTKKKIILRAATYESFSLVKPDSHMHARARELEPPSRFKVQTRNTCSLPNRANG